MNDDFAKRLRHGGTIDEEAFGWIALSALACVREDACAAGHMITKSAAKLELVPVDPVHPCQFPHTVPCSKN